MSKNNKLKKVYRHPVVKAALVIVEDIPGPGTIISASRQLAEQTYDNMIAERKAAYFQELENGGEITDEMLTQEEFIHSVIVTYNASLRTYQQKKIRRFAKILLKAIEENELASDKFEVFVRILDDLTETESAFSSCCKSSRIPRLINLKRMASQKMICSVQAERGRILKRPFANQHIFRQKYLPIISISLTAQDYFKRSLVHFGATQATKVALRLSSVNSANGLTLKLKSNDERYSDILR